MNIFGSDRDRRSFLGLLAEASAESDTQVVAYCLVGNHFHLILHCPTGGLSKVMWKLGAEYARIFNHRAGRDGPLFRGRFLSKTIDDTAYLRHVIAYVHRNSLDLGVEPEAWPWSSCQIYLGCRRAPSWMHADEALRIIGGISQHQADLATPPLSNRDRAGEASPAELHSIWRTSSSLRLLARIETILDGDPRLSPRDRADALRLVAFDHAGVPYNDAFEQLGAATSKNVRNQTARARQRAKTDRRLATAVERAALTLALVHPSAA